MEKKIAPMAYAAFFMAAATTIIWFLGPLTLTAGILALRDIKRNANYVGKGRAIVGVAWGAIGTIITLFFLLFVVAQIIGRK